MASHRLERINAQIQRELSLIINQKAKDKRLHNSTFGITDVKATQDLKVAKVYISVIGTQQEKEDIINALNNAKGFLRSSLGHVLKTHTTPELIFKIDESVEYGMHIDKILSDLKHENNQ
jgi:ribosome-binding factor A